MPGLIIDGREEQVPGLEIVNYHDFPQYKLIPGEDMRSRRYKDVRSIGIHNTKNIETELVLGVGPDTKLEERITQLWSLDKRHAGAHLAVDFDTTIVCMADLVQDATYHASSMNEYSIGIEIYEDGHGRVYEAQLNVVVALIEWLCARFGIQRQMPPVYFDGEVTRIVHGGSDYYGVFGHSHQYSGKRHDPGRDIFRFLKSAGFMEFNFNNNEDKTFWKMIQSKYGINSDGIPGPITTDILRDAGYRYGLWRQPEESAHGG